jgi:hypothetical protein
MITHVIKQQSVFNPITMGDLLQAVDRTHFPSPQLTYCKLLIFDMEKYGQPIRAGQLWTWRNFDVYFEPA